ncbi:MAG: NAD(P)/FAD-dependent oxidoreductase, partial [Enterobacteriaceae bacterium]
MSEQIRICDLLVIGAGPAGIAAATAAVTSGLSVILLDNNNHYGGQLWRHGAYYPPPHQARRAWQQLQQGRSLTVLMAQRVVMVEPQQVVCESDNSYTQIQCRQMILCCGAREQFLPFPGWTLPGVTGAGGLQALIKGGVSVRGQRVVIAGSGPLLLATAKTVRAAGGKVLAVLEQAQWRTLLAFGCGLWRWPGKLWQAVTLITPSYSADAYVEQALGQQRLEAVLINHHGRQKELQCDHLACAWGLVPNSELGQLLGCTLDKGAIVVDNWQQSTISGIYAAGECTGIGGGELARITGAIAGYAAAGEQAAAQKLWRKKQY